MITTILAAAGLAMPITDAPVHRGDFRASTFTTSSQGEADLAVAGDGSFVSVWSSRRQNGGKYGVFAQRFDGDGVAVGEEFSLSAWRENHQLAPAVAQTSLGITWAVWQSHGQDGEAGSIICRLFDGENASDEILVNTTVAGHQNSPVVAGLTGGGAVVAWEDVQHEGTRRVRYRVLDASGHALGDEKSVSVGGELQGTASVAAGVHGFAIAWSEFDATTGQPLGVRVRTFGDDGEALGDAIAPAAYANSQVEPVIKATGEGYVLAWIDAAEGEHRDSYDVLASRLDAGGVAVSKPIVVNSAIGGVQNAPAIAIRDDGAIAIGYNSDEDQGRGVYARLFDAELAPLGESFRLTDVDAGDQTMREAAGTSRMAFNAMGELLCAWSGDAGLGDTSSANVTLASPRALAVVERGVVDGMCEAPFTNLTDAAAGPHIPPTFSPLDIARDEKDVRITPEEIGFLAVTNTGWTPPDPHMAVGANHVVVMTNGEIAFFTKDGTRTFRDEIEDSFGFWGSVGATGFVFDPEVLYDAQEGRFVAMAAEAFAPGNRSFVLIAVSDDGDPNGTWHKYRLDTTSLAGDLFDSPNIGVTDDAVIVTGDGFGLGANYPIFSWDKASLYAGDPPAISRQRTMNTSTQSAGIPPTSVPDPGVLYMIEHQEGNSRTRVRLIAMGDALGAPSITTTLLTVPSYGAPANPSQMGTGTRPNTFDARFWSTAFANGTLWATHHVSSPVVRIRWYEIDMRGWPDSGNSPELVQSGEIQPDGNTHTFFSSIAANADGLAAVTYAQSSTSEFISMRTAYRLAGDPLGTMRLGEAQQTNTGPYTVTRWGDYSSCEIDPADNATIWSDHEYAINNSWRTWVAGLVTETDCPADLDGDGDADADDFFAYLDAFAGGNLDVCDIDGDGDCDADDFFAYLDLFAQGC